MKINSLQFTNKQNPIYQQSKILKYQQTITQLIELQISYFFPITIFGNKKQQAK